MSLINNELILALGEETADPITGYPIQRMTSYVGGKELVAKIPTLESDIATNATNIASNDADITYISGEVASNDADITYISGEVASNDADIAYLQHGDIFQLTNTTDTYSFSVIGDYAILQPNDSDLTNTWIDYTYSTGQFSLLSDKAYMCAVSVIAYDSAGTCELGFLLQQSIDSGTTWTTVQSSYNSVSTDGGLLLFTFPMQRPQSTHVFRFVATAQTGGNAVIESNTIATNVNIGLTADHTVPGVSLILMQL